MAYPKGRPSPNLKHGMFGTRTYATWASMLERCRHGKDPVYAGVPIHPAWVDFRAFYADMGERPEGMTLDRIDGAKGYEPGNCRWATRQTQSENRKNVRWYEHEGKTLTIAGWARELGLSKTSLHRNLVYNQLPFDQAISKK